MTEKIKCLVVDDEKLARTLLERYIEKLPNLELVAKCKDSFEALQVLETNTIDLIFLDIQMPELTGIELLKTLQYKPLIIFTTAYQEYALEGYQLDIVDYLLKPFRFDRFVQAVHKASRRLHQSSNPENEHLSAATNEESRAFVLVKSNHKTYKIFLDEILYIQSMKEYVAYHLPGKRILVLQALKKLEQDLPQSMFTRIHKSYIVSRNKVTAMDGQFVYVGKEKLPIGGNYKEKIQDLIF